MSSVLQKKVICEFVLMLKGIEEKWQAVPEEWTSIQVGKWLDFFLAQFVLKSQNCSGSNVAYLSVQDAKVNIPRDF